MSGTELVPFNMKTIRPVLAECFFGKDKVDANLQYVLPLQANWFAPTVDNAQMVSTWIGYAITKIQPRVTSITRYTDDGQRVDLRNCAVTVRLSAVGKQAEEAIESTLWWDARNDVQTAWESVLAQLKWSARTIDTYVYFQQGFNSELIWSVDLQFMVWMFTPPFQEDVWGSLSLNGSIFVQGDIPYPSDKQ